MTDARLYTEALRAQFHFTAERNWLNDPNGMVYHEGEYHLFFQHNPQGIDWGHMTWGHAVSKDMVHWRQLPHAIHPDDRGTIFSGSAIVDVDNSGGFQAGEDSPLVAFFTYATKHPGCQALAYSNDRGRTFTKYNGNPVVPSQTQATDRDPKVFWHGETAQWVMVLYLDEDNTFAFFVSADLRSWTRVSTIQGFFECPDFFELPVDGDEGNTRWVLHGASGAYLVGRFDGREFAPDQTRKLPLDHGANFYAAQSFNNMPHGRRVQIAWMRGGSFPGMLFNQQMSFPCELTLRSTPDGLRVHRWPVKEIECLYDGEERLFNVPLAEGGSNPLADVQGELFDIEAEVAIGTAKEIGFGIRGQVYSYDVRKQSFNGSERGTMAPESGRIKVRVLVDRASIELFGNDGLVSITDSVIFSPNSHGVDIYSRGGDAVIEKIVVRKLRSIWWGRE